MKTINNYKSTPNFCLNYHEATCVARVVEYCRDQKLTLVNVAKTEGNDPYEFTVRVIQRSGTLSDFVLQCFAGEVKVLESEHLMKRDANEQNPAFLRQVRP